MLYDLHLYELLLNVDGFNILLTFHRICFAVIPVVMLLLFVCQIACLASSAGFGLPCFVASPADGFSPAERVRPGGSPRADRLARGSRLFGTFP